MKSLEKIALRYASRKIRNGDLLSFQPTCKWYKPWTLWTWLIAIENDAHICHSAMAAWLEGELCCVQMDSAKDRIVILDSYVRRWPGSIIVSRALVPKGFNRRHAVRRMLAMTIRPYGWMRIIVLAFSRTITGRLLYPGMSKDCEKSKYPPICSEAYSRAMRLEGFDPIPGRADYRTEPHHLYESNKFKPLFILI
jgi:hypothetical protein